MREEVIQELNGLLEKNYDAEQGFTTAFNATNNLRLKSYFDKQIRQRVSFGKNIKDEIISLGGTVHRGGSLTGAIHRAWMDMKTAASTVENQDETILSSCQNGEQAMLDDYNDFLKKDNIPAHILSLVKEQRNAILESIRELQLFETIEA